MICTNQTRKFLARSKSGNYYLVLLYDYNVNTILVALIIDRKSHMLQKAFISLFHQVKQKGYAPTIIHLDNKLSYKYLNLIENLDLKVQLVLLYNY